MNKLLFWCLFFAISFSIAYLLSNTLIPFITAFILAYLLQPLIHLFQQKLSISRTKSTNLTFLIFLGSFVVVIILIIPVIYQQVALLVSKAPQYKNNLAAGIELIANKLDEISPDIAQKLASSISNLIDHIFSLFADVANHLWQYTLATLNFFTITALVPIILYYFLKDWPKIVENIESLLPKRGKSKVRAIFLAINDLLAAYIRGQLNLCLLLAIYYILGLSLIGLDLALLLGLLAGFLIIIPFLGALISFLLMLVSCYFSFGWGVELFYVLILYLIGHSVEGYILTPKIIGGKIGLHPLWIIFSIFAAGSVFGFIGVLFAVPLAGIVKVLLINILSYYKSSNIYRN